MQVFRVVSGKREMKKRKNSCIICNDSRYIIKDKKDNTKECVPCPNINCNTSKILNRIIKIK